MKLIKIMKNWILIALFCSAVVSIIFLGQNFTKPVLLVFIPVVLGSFIAVLISGALLEQKLVKRFQNELKGR